MDTIKKAEALARMRELSRLNIPFSFSFYSYSTKNGYSSVYKVIDKALLRAGLRQDQSNKHNLLIAYIDYSDKEDKNRQFYYPLLMTFNGQKVTP